MKSDDNGHIKNDVLTIIWDFKVGSDNTGSEEVIEKQLLEECNHYGERLVEMSIMNNLIIRGTFLNTKNIHKTTWMCPNVNVENQIDHILIYNTAITVSFESKKCADVYSDHHLVIRNIRLKLGEINKNNKHLRLSLASTT